ncbi:MAG: DUF1127 domain-containing protein [Kiloniellales bacterium]|nr:DUF1127 domain-containing protein [Kiloniellales bacterium]
MSRLSEREMEEIRRVKRAVEDEAREEFSQVRLADDVDTRHPVHAAGFLARVARMSGLAEIAWMVRHEVVLPLRQRIQMRRAVAELQRLDDRALRDIGIERGQIETIVRAMKPETPRSPRPEVGPVAAIRRWIVRRRTIKALSALDDRLLEDIGLVRAHIPDFVRDLDEAIVSGRIEGMTAAQKVRNATGALRALRQWNLSRQAANDMSRLDPEALADLGYVKGDVDWVPEVLAERKLTAA